jgi:hypothetical protein
MSITRADRLCNPIVVVMLVPRHAFMLVVFVTCFMLPAALLMHCQMFRPALFVHSYMLCMPPLHVFEPFRKSIFIPYVVSLMLDGDGAVLMMFMMPGMMAVMRHVRHRFGMRRPAFNLAAFIHAAVRGRCRRGCSD